MDTVARTGIAGFIVGNTAESILRNVDCSVLTVKPEGFVSPIKVQGLLLWEALWPSVSNRRWTDWPVVRIRTQHCCFLSSLNRSLFLCRRLVPKKAGRYRWRTEQPS